MKRLTNILKTYNMIKIFIFVIFIGFSYIPEVYAAICGDNLEGCPVGQSCWKKRNSIF